MSVDIARIVADYLALFPDERDNLKDLLKQIEATETLNDRKNFNGHITGSAVVLSPDHTQILLIHHNLFHKWLQPGGHWEDEASPWVAAQREAAEETGVHIQRQLAAANPDISIPLDIATHHIIARPDKNEPPHLHHDFRYVFEANVGDLINKPNEVSAAEWVTLNDPRLKNIPSIVDKLQRLNFLTR